MGSTANLKKMSGREGFVETNSGYTTYVQAKCHAKCIAFGLSFILFLLNTFIACAMSFIYDFGLNLFCFYCRSPFYPMQGLEQNNVVPLVVHPFQIKINHWE